MSGEDVETLPWMDRTVWPKATWQALGDTLMKNKHTSVLHILLLYVETLQTAEISTVTQTPEGANINLPGVNVRMNNEIII